MTYYDDLTNDEKRVNTFFKAIKQEVNGICYDLGTGSGILASYASRYAEKVYAIEQNPLIITKTRDYLKEYDNVKLIDADATEYEFQGKIDVVICEMLDTALIDEEQIPVINHVVKYTNDDTIFIPMAVYSTVELINAQVMGICYHEDEHPKYTSLSDEVKYGRINLNQYNDPEYEEDIQMKVKTGGLLNAIKITTYTILTDDIILEPTPMLNPPLIIPVEELDVEKGDNITINLKYTMGGGLNTIQTTRKTNN
ncbi:MAG: methyltransferase domain-containing protein [Methanosphaera sp.]|nr:methyltransferase domain-containing protein [Methanosphaera sp.]